MTPGFTEFVRSRRLAVSLLIGAAALAMLGTIFTAERAEPALASFPWLRAAARFLGVVDTPRSPVFLLLVAAIGVTMITCTWHRTTPLRGKAGGTVAAPRRLRLALDAAMHLSLLAIVAGGVGKGVLGSVRTKNIHVGQAADAFFDFVRDADVSLGFTVEVRERMDSWHPGRAMIGLSDPATGAKIGLVEAVEGRTVAAPGANLSLRLEGFSPSGRVLRLAASGRGRTGTVDLEAAEGGKGSADFGALRLTLVAWKRELKGVRSLIACVGGGRAPQVGWISPQERLTCRGVSFAMTAWGTDPDGFPYVGIQAVRDPAAPLFWGGCIGFVVFLALFVTVRARESGDRAARSRRP
jgi:hypothetical protein